MKQNIEERLEYLYKVLSLINHNIEDNVESILFYKKCNNKFDKIFKENLQGLLDFCLEKDKRLNISYKEVINEIKHLEQLSKYKEFIKL